MKKIKTRLISYLLVFAMLLSVVPVAAFAADATSSEMYGLLEEYYDGDAAQARSALAKLQSAGFLDEKGDIKPIDIQYNGKSISFEVLAAMISNGEADGAITFNGKSVTADQVTELKQLYDMLEFVLSLYEDVTVTDETVENLKSLTEAIAAGKLDFGQGAAALKSSAPLILAASSLEGADPTWPDTTSDFGDLALEGEDGAKYYEEHYVGKEGAEGGAGYDEDYHFVMLNQNGTKWYSDDQFDGSGINADAAVTFTVTGQESGQTYFAPGKTVTVKATLDKAQPVPVSFKLRVVDGSVSGAAFSGGAVEQTVSWDKNTSGDKTFTVSIPAVANDDKWNGDRVFYLQAYDFRNAACGTNDVWEQAVKVHSAMELGLKYVLSYSKEEKHGEGLGWNLSGDPMAIYDDVKSLSGPLHATNYHYSATLSISESNPYGSNQKIEKHISEPYHDITLRVGGKQVVSERKSGILDNTYSWSGDFVATEGSQEVYYFRNYFMQGQYEISFIEGNTDHADSPFTPDSVTSFQLTIQDTRNETKITDISVPDGQFYYGQNVPIVVTYDYPVVISNNMSLKVANGGESGTVLTPVEVGTLSKTCTYLYPVQKIDTGTVRVSSAAFAGNNLSGKTSSVQGGNEKGVCLTNSDLSDISESKLGNTNCKLISDNKLGSLRKDDGSYNVTYGISDEPPTLQTLVIQYDLRQDDKAYYEWIGDKESVDISGTPVEVVDKTGAVFSALDYLAGAYISCNGGMTRYPLFVERSTDGSEKPIALVANLAPDVNPTADIRKDTYELFFEKEPITAASTYLPAFSAAEEDTAGNLYFVCGTRDENVKDKLVFTPDSSLTEASAVLGAAYTLLVKGGIFLEEAYGDVTIVGNSTWNSIHNACAIETSVPTLKLSYTINDRQPDAVPYYTKNMFTFRADEWFTWESSDKTIATIEKDGTINLTGKPGTCRFTLTILNGNIEQFIYTLESEDLTVKEGLSPYLLIPQTSSERMTLKGAETAVYFTTNLTARNAAEGKDSTDFSIDVYRSADLNKYDEPNEGAEPVYTGKITNTLTESASRLVIPENVLTDISADPSDYTYVAIISADYYDGSAYSASAHISVKLPPAKVELNKLDSYYVLSDAIPALGYTVENAGAGMDTYYTVQKSGSALQTYTLTGESGTIPTSAFTKPAGLKEIYSITVYAKNPADEAYSIDSMSLTVYNRDLLDLVVADVARGSIGGTTGGAGNTPNEVVLDNTSYIKGMLTGRNEIKLGDGATITLDDLRFDTNLQKAISVNYGDDVFGMLSDRIAWESAQSNIASVDFKQGGVYSDVDSYTYTSYAPVNDLLIVGHKDGKTTVTAEHVNTGMTSSVDVTVNTLKDKLYIFQFLPKQETTVQYYTVVNGSRTFVTVKSNAEGQLAVYEPNGIQSDVWLRSGDAASGLYLGTIYQDDLYTAEKDITALRVYPCNDKALQLASEVTLYFRNPDGSAYANKTVTLRGGVYKNGLYCPNANFRTNADNYASFKNGRADFTAKTDSNGAVTIRMDADEFYVSSNTETLYGADMLDFVFEYRFSEADCVPGYVTCTVNGDQSSDTRDGLVNIIKASGNAPVLIKQTVQQFYLEDGAYTPTNYTMDVANSRDNVGPSNEFEKVRLENVVALRGVAVTTTENGYASFENSEKYSAGLVDENGVAPVGQNAAAEAAAVITDLETLTDETTAAFVFPFSSVPMLRSVYVMNRANLGQKGSTKHTADDGSSVYDYTYLGYGETVHAKVVTTKDGATVCSAMLPFAFANYADKSNPMTDGSTEEVGRSAQASVKDRLDIGFVFDEVDVNELLKTGFKFFISLGMENADLPVDLAIFPTEDPAVFRVLISMGLDSEEDDDDDEDEDSLELGYDVEVSPKQAMKAIEELTKDDDDDDDDEDEDDPTSFSFNFHGAVEAEVSLADDSWDVEFIGGSVGAGAKAGIEYDIDFMVGPVPALISFEAGAGVDLTVFFAKGDDATDIMIKALLEASIEAFAGVGVDNTLFELTLGIFGGINAEAEILFLKAAYDSVGMHLGIDGEIGLRFTARVLMVSYSKVLASTSFGWEKSYKDYDGIQEYWDGKDLQLMGMTNNGDPVQVTLTKDGNALLTVDQNCIESRDYLNDFTREWAGGSKLMLLGAAPEPGTPSLIQSNAYPYAQPRVTDDGKVLIYISDEDSSDEVRSALHYALQLPDGTYDEYGTVDSGMLPQSHADTAAALSGINGNYVAVWAGQVEDLKKEAGEKATGDDLAMMMNSSEIFAGVYDQFSERWSVTRLTNNDTGDVSPAAASAGTKAIAAWRNVDSSNLQTDEDMLSSFNVSDAVCYRYYNGSVWEPAQIAFNGSCGSINSLSAAMLPDGTALLAYSVTTDEADTSSEVFYTLVDKDGEAVNTVRVTNNTDRDLSVSAATLEGQFLLGWYSEHNDFREPATIDGKPETTLVRSIRFAAVDKAGAISTEFDESFNSETSADFAIVGKENGTLTDLYILWSEKNGDAYEIKAVKFCDADGSTVLSAPNTVAKTSDLVTIENFDAYLDGSGKLNTVLLGADYSASQIKEVGKVDLNSLTDMNGKSVASMFPTEPTESMLAILEAEPEYKIFKASAALPENALKAAVKKPDLQKLMRGLTLPVYFTVSNTGTEVLEDITVEIGGISKTFTDVNLLPGASTMLTMGYEVPQAVSDVSYTVSANGVSESGTIKLNCPDVGIKSVKLLSETDTKRTVEVTLENASDILLDNSGKTVKLAFYKDSAYEKMIGSEITVSADEYANIDRGIYTFQQTLNVSDVLGSASREIPAKGVKVYVKAWVEDTDEPYTLNNTDMITLRSLLTKNNDEIFTMNADVIPDGDDFKVSAFLRNNSVKTQQSERIDALLLDENGIIIGQKENLVAALDSFTGEQTKTPEITILASEVEGTPVTVQLIEVNESGATITFNANGGSCAVTELKVGSDNCLDYLPTPTLEGKTFAGWFTAETDGEKITENTVFTSDTEIFAHWQTAGNGGGGGGSVSSGENLIELAEQPQHGTVEIDPEQASAGDIVTITVTPDEGYKLDFIKVTDKNGNAVELTDLGNGKYSFKMPDEDISVEVAFVPLQSYATCLGDDICPMSEFTDVNTAAWYHNGVHYCLDNGIMAGFPGDLFKPNGTITRAQIAQILYNLEGQPAFMNDNVFTDVVSGSWYEKAVVWAQGKGIVSGYGNETFGPDTPINREQLVTILYNYAKFKGQGFTGDWMFLLNFVDRADISPWADEAVHWCSMKGIVSGKSGNVFDPKGSATRAEAATMMLHFCEVLEK